MKRNEKKGKRKTNFKKIAIEYGLLALILFLITGSIIQGSLVPTPSMERTIRVGDRIFINKLAYGITTPRYIPFTDIELPHATLFKWSSPKRGDAVVFQFPGDRDKLKHDKVEFWVKRCLALPGDKIEVINRVVYVNGKESPIPPEVQYLNRTTKPKDVVEPELFPKGSAFNTDNYGPITVPGKGDIIHLTPENIDQWKTFIDREFDKEVVQLEGNKIFIDGKETYDYTVKDNYYFMMGDNRDISYDCRYWGFVPERNIAGKPICVYFSWDSDIPFSNIIDLIKSIRLDRIGKIIN